MCDPITIGAATALLGVGQVAMQTIGQNQLAESTRTAANLNYAQASDVTQQKAMQLDQEKSQTAMDTAITTARAQGEIANSASSQGLGKASISSALHAEMFGIGRNQGIADLNDLNARAQLANEMRGAAITRETTIAGAPKASALAVGLGVGSALLGGANSYNTAKRAH